jgi:hypothetical protein
MSSNPAMVCTRCGKVGTVIGRREWTGRDGRGRRWRCGRCGHCRVQAADIDGGKMIRPTWQCVEAKERET